MKQFRENVILAVVFMIALPMFVWLRWNPEPWFNTQMETRGLSRYVQVATVEKSGLGLRLNTVHIQIPGRKNINLNDIEVSPAWLRIITGTPALHAQGTIDNAAFSLNVSMQHGAIWLRDMDIHAPAGRIGNHVPQASMLNLAGNILIAGAIKLRQSDGVPLAGAISLQWKQAGSSLLGQDTLGDFRLQLTASQKGEWRWNIEGGNMLSLNGKGHLSTASRNPTGWKVDGHIHTQSQGRIASLLAGIAGHKQGNFVLSGTLVQPRIQFLEP